MQDERYESLRSKRKTNELAYARSAKIAKIENNDVLETIETNETNKSQKIPKKPSKKPKLSDKKEGVEKSGSRQNVITLIEFSNYNIDF